jgi:hypothetical protein
MSENKMLHTISLGAGVQSSTMALMFAVGELMPMPDCAIFADTGAEPRAVYEWLNWLEQHLPFPVHRVMEQDGLRQNIIDSVTGGRFAGAPFYTETMDGKRAAGQLRRQCTREFKVQPITRKLRELVGLEKGQRAPPRLLAVQYIGISLDESIRMRPAREHWIEHRWPLVDAGMRRLDCIVWMSEHGYRRPPRSACTFCPYHDDSEWKALKESPDDWPGVIKIDRLIRGGVRGTPQKLYLHRSLKPIADIDFSSAEDRGQGTLFGDECEGMCGV